MRGVAEAFLAALRELIEHCCAPEAGGVTPSDFPLAALDQATLDREFAGRARDLEDLYPLSPMQEGMLFHSLYAPEGGEYVVQLRFGLGPEVEPGLLEQAWSAVVNRHPVLRSRVAWQGLDRPLQVVQRRVEVPVEHRTLARWHRHLPVGGPRSRPGPVGGAADAADVPRGTGR